MDTQTWKIGVNTFGRKWKGMNTQGCEMAEIEHSGGCERKGGNTQKWKMVVGNGRE